MQMVTAFERGQGRVVQDVHEKNLGYDLTSIDLNSGELRLIEVKGIGLPSGDVMLTPNEYRVAADRRDCYWLYVVTDCTTAGPRLLRIRDPFGRLSRRAERLTVVKGFVLPAQAVEAVAEGDG